MIRTKHNVDTFLIDSFLSEKIFDAEINELLLNWYSSLGNPNHQTTRDNAIAFLKMAAKRTLTEIDYPFKQREELVQVFEPLELLLRIALPLKTPGDKVGNVRDHLSHTIRNILFSIYILRRFHPKNYTSLQMQLIIAVIFHDIAYPIEKIKKVAHKLGNATFKNLLNSKGDVEIELDRPDELLNVLDFFGRLILYKENELKISSTPEKKELIEKIKHLYREIVSKSIAGTGLFDSSHSISSVVLFILPIIRNSKDPQTYQDSTLNTLADICLTMTYHDRSNFIQKIYGFPIPLTLRILRITDELQEWDREFKSYIEDVEILNNIASIIEIKIKMKDKSESDLCIPEMFLPDKVNGLLPAVIDDEIIKIHLEFPQKVKGKSLQTELTKLKNNLKKNEDIVLNYEINDSENGKYVDLVFTQGMASIKIINSKL